jgi:hypothetical protein
VKVLLIGLGRIGKLVARKIVAQDDPRLDWVGAVEQTQDPELFSYLLNHDSTYGPATSKIGYTADSLEVTGQGAVPFFTDVALAINETNPDLVIDCSGSNQSAETLVGSERKRTRCHLFAQALDAVKRARDTDSINLVSDRKLYDYKRDLCFSPQRHKHAAESRQGAALPPLVQSVWVESDPRAARQHGPGQQILSGVGGSVNR